MLGVVFDITFWRGGVGVANCDRGKEQSEGKHLHVWNGRSK